MAYDRFGMTPTAASTLTGVAGLTDADLERAEDELEELLGFAILPEEYDVEAWTYTAVGRAVAWQAAYRVTVGPDVAAGTVSADAVKSENIGDYSYTVEDGATTGRPPVAPRAWDILARSGLLAERTTGRTSQPTRRSRRA